MTSLQTTPTVAAFAMLSLATTLAGCSASDGTAADTGTDTGTDSGSDVDTATSGTYTDGTYTESGDYQAPSGTETMTVTVTLADNVITKVVVVGDATDPTA